MILIKLFNILDNLQPLSINPLQCSENTTNLKTTRKFQEFRIQNHQSVDNTLNQFH